MKLITMRATWAIAKLTVNTRQHAIGRRRSVTYGELLAAPPIPSLGIPGGSLGEVRKSPVLRPCVNGNTAYLAG